MKNRFLSVLLTLAILATVEDAPPANASVDAPAKLPDNLSPAFPRVGVDHVVTYSAWRGWGPKGGDRIVLFRHGAMIRTETDYIGSKRAGEATHGTAFSNLATTAALSIGRGSDGSLAGVSVSRGGPDDIPIYRHTVIATDASETIVGERCMVWAAKPETGEGVLQTACITRDGIVLRETVLYHDGSVMSERSAIKVERRSVRLREVLPPADALQWATWAARTSAASSAKNGSNYELTLAGTQDGKPVTKVIREAGGWHSEEDRGDSVVRSLQISNSAVTLSYSNRTHPQLMISRGKASPQFDTHFSSAPLTKPEEMVINERCTWYDAAVGVADYGRLECRTPDQMPLIRNEFSRGHLRISWMATGLSRGHTPIESVSPSASLMDWSFWGWPQLKKR